jgi:anti-sigma-K factor RskA
MTCNGQPADDYQLYALGVLEGEEAETIRGHLRQGCDACLSGVRRGTAFWTIFTEAEIPLQSPPARLQARILNQIQPTRAAWWLGWKQAAGVAALALISAVGGWWAAHRPAEPPRVVTQITTDPRQQTEIADLRRQLEEARKRKDEPPPEPVRGAAADAALRRELEQAKLATAEAARALEAERARAGQLQNQIQESARQLEASQRERLETGKKFQALVDERTRDAADRERQLAAVRARVQELERENAKIRNVLATQEKQLQQSLRLAGFLSSPSLRFVRLRATGTGAGAEGHAFVAEGSRVVFYASKLPALPPGRVYQLWLLRGTGPAVVSGGVFRASGDRQLVEFSDPALVRSIRGLAVTDEPEGGSPKPTGAKFLVGSSS